MGNKGDYGHRTLVGAFEPTAHDGLPTSTYFGLSLAVTWFYLNFRDADGTLYFAYRTTMGLEGTLHFTCNKAQDGALRKMEMPAGDEWFRGPVVTSASDDIWTMKSKPFEAGYATGHPFEMRRHDEHLHYHEGDHLAFEGRRIGPGMQVYVPSGPSPLFYSSLQHRVSGTAFGKEATGFLWLDQCYLPPGVTWRNSSYFAGVELAWTPFGTEYEDGSVEMGHIAYGADGFNFAFVSEQDPQGTTSLLHCSSDVQARDIVYKDNTFPDSMTYLADGQEWLWTHVEDGELPEMASGHDFYRSSEGYLRRAGETRKPVAFHSYNEFFPPAIQHWESTGRIIGR